jgi:ribosomal protein S18 acetylase RimI-like enzyme
MDISYSTDVSVSVGQFVELLRESTLGERRPVDDRACLEGMLANANLTVTAWDGDRLVGIARSVTDFHFACYLSDLAVHREYQRKGIGKRLQVLTQQQLGPHCSLILLAAPAANEYYGHIGYTNNPRCWVLARDQRIE